MNLRWRPNRTLNRAAPVFFEGLEDRVLLSAAPMPAVALANAPSDFVLPVSSVAEAHMAHPIAIVQSVSPNATAPGNALTPTQMRQAYGLNQVMFGSIQGDGTGQTIAIIDAYNAPTVVSDLHAL